MKKLVLRLLVALAVWFVPNLSNAQTYSALGRAVNNNNSLFDTLSNAPNDSLLFRFANTHSIPFGTATLVVYYQGNFYNDYLNLYDETTNYQGSTNYSMFNCAPEDSTIWTFSSVDISSWNANDSIDFLLIPSGGTGFCALNKVRMKLTYNYCLNGPPVQFSALSISDTSTCALGGVYPLTGSPAGGMFSGPGVTGSNFNPINLNSGSYNLLYTATDANGCMTTGNLYVAVGSSPIVNNNSTNYACYGTSINLNASGGTQFAWFSDVNQTQFLDSAIIYTTPSLTTSTAYYVSAIDFMESFTVDTLLAFDSLIVDENNIAGDDRGGMAITHTHVYLNGDNNCVRYDLDLNPASGVPLPIRDGMFSDLRSAKIWTLWNNALASDPQGGPSQFTVDAIRGLDSNLAFTNEIIQLSQSIDMGTYNQQNGIFAGYGYLGLYSGDTQHWYVVDLDNGFVTDLGYLNSPQFYGSENWSDWGILEATCDGTFSVVYRDYNDADIHRRVLPNGPVTSVGSFGDLSDMASLIFCPWNNRWYWHYEGSTSTFGGSAETLGYSDAAFSEASCSASGLGCPSIVTVNVPADVTFNFPSATVCLNDGAQLLSQGLPLGGSYSGIGVGTNASGTVFFPALSGNGTFNLTYTVTDSASGCVDFATDVVIVDACSGVVETTFANGISVYPNPNSGTFNVAINASATEVLIEVMDLQGRVVFSSMENNVASGFVKQISLENISSGMYMMKLSSGNDQKLEKISVQK